MKVEYGVLRVLMDRAGDRPHPAAMEFCSSRDGGDVQVDKVSVGEPPEHKIFRQLSKLGAQRWDLVRVQSFYREDQIRPVYNLYFKKAR